MAKCLHEHFNVEADVNRIASNLGGPITHYTMDIRVMCSQCFMPFEFIGLEAGLMPTKPMCDTSAQEARMPIKPKGSLLMPGIPGFGVRVH